MAKQLKYQDEASRAVKIGVDKLANAVGVTMGPKGRYVVLDKKFGSPVITNDGVITVEEGKSAKTEVEVVTGMKFDRGYVSPYFITDPERMETVLEDCTVIVLDKKVSALNELLPFLEKLLQVGNRPFLLIAEEIDGE